MIILKNPDSFRQLSSLLSYPLKMLLLSTRWLFAALPCSWYCTNLWMDHHQSAYQEWNRYRACDPWHMDQNWKIERWEAEYVYLHIRVAHLLFRSFEFSQCHWMAQVAFRVWAAPVVVEVHRCLSASRESGFCAVPFWLGSQPSG